jgi:uracil-DNA glycosylase family 4
MGYFFNQVRAVAKKRPKPATLKQLPTDTLAKLGCSACPLNVGGAAKLEPKSSSSPLVYIVRGRPSAVEDNKGVGFIDEASKFLEKFIPAKMKRYIRYGYAVRCKADTESSVEMACCSKYLLEDIEATKPAIVIGLGNLPLQVLTSLPGGVFKWRGRRIACKVGGHSFWFLPTYEPEFVMEKQGKYGSSEFDGVFAYDLRRVLFRDIDWELPPPTVYQGEFDKGIDIITGQEAGDLNRLVAAFSKLLSLPKVAIDIETSGLRPYNKDAAIYTVAIGTFDYTVAFSLAHPDGWSAANQARVWDMLGQFILYSGVKIAHHLGFEQEWLSYYYGPTILRKTGWGDTLAAAHTLDETPGTHSLDVLCREYFGFFLKDKSPVDVKKLLSYPIREVLRYNGMDTKWTHRLDGLLDSKLSAEPKYRAEYDRKVSLCPTLVRTEQKGLRPDLDYAKLMSDNLTEELRLIETKLYRCPEVREFEKRYRRKLSPTAPEDALVMLRDICDRSEVRKGDGYSSDESVLSSIPPDEVPSASLILEHRGASKVLGTYITPILTGAMTHDDGLIHSKYSSMRAVTGRLSSEDPNVQNFPKRKRREIRGVIAAPEGSWMVACDYGQIEARVIGMASEDRNLVDYLWTGYDIHGYWADRILSVHPKTKDRIIKDYGVDGDDAAGIRKKLRDETKNRWVFPQFFGSSFRSCASGLSLPEHLAEDLAREFWDEFKGVQKWQKKIMEGYKQNLYVETLSGRKRRGAMSKNELINHPIQGTAADIVTEAMTALSVLADLEEDDEYQADLNVHDDLSFMLLDASMDVKIPIIAREMCRHRFPYIIVPLIVEVQVGVRWHELKEIGVYRSNEMFNLKETGR